MVLRASQRGQAGVAEEIAADQQILQDFMGSRTISKWNAWPLAVNGWVGRSIAQMPRLVRSGHEATTHHAPHTVGEKGAEDWSLAVRPGMHGHGRFYGVLLLPRYISRAPLRWAGRSMLDSRVHARLAAGEAVFGHEAGNSDGGESCCSGVMHGHVSDDA